MKTIIAEICEEIGLVDEIPFVICDSCGDSIDQMKCVTVMVSKENQVISIFVMTIATRKELSKQRGVQNEWQNQNG